MPVHDYLITDTGSFKKVSSHRQWMLSVVVGTSCTFGISLVLVVCWVYWCRSRFLFTSHGTYLIMAFSIKQVDDGDCTIL